MSNNHLMTMMRIIIKIHRENSLNHLLI